MSISPLTGILIPVPDVPWRSPWRIALESRMHEPVRRYVSRPVVPPVRAKVVRAPKPPREPKERKVAAPRAPKGPPKPYSRPSRPKTVRIACPFNCGRLILPSNTWGICTPCRQEHKYMLRYGIRKACACGNPMNRNNHYGMCGKCYHKARYMMKKRGEC